jgi:hypothetical protein
VLRGTGKGSPHLGQKATQRFGANNVDTDDERQIELSKEALFRARLDYVMRSFMNTQDLIRFMDQKAGYLLSAVGLLTTALGIVAAKALDANTNLTWYLELSSPGLIALLKVLSFISFVGYLLLAFVVLANATKVFKALPNLLKRPSTAPGLLFPLILLEKYKKGTDAGGDTFYRQLLNVQGNDILNDFAEQVMEISNIYQRKQQQINTSIRWFEYLGVAWIISIILLLAITILH